MREKKRFYDQYKNCLIVEIELLVIVILDDTVHGKNRGCTGIRKVKCKKIYVFTFSSFTGVFFVLASQLKIRLYKKC